MTHPNMLPIKIDAYELKIKALMNMPKQNSYYEEIIFAFLKDYNRKLAGFYKELNK